MSAKSELCPTCGREKVSSTVELDIPIDPEDLSEEFSHHQTTRRATPAESSICSWCQKPALAVRKLLAGPGVQICDECVALCYHVLRAEYADWPPERG